LKRPGKDLEFFTEETVRTLGTCVYSGIVFPWWSPTRVLTANLFQWRFTYVI